MRRQGARHNFQPPPPPTHTHTHTTAAATAAATTTTTAAATTTSSQRSPSNTTSTGPPAGPAPPTNFTITSAAPRPAPPAIIPKAARADRQPPVSRPLAGRGAAQVRHGGGGCGERLSRRTARAELRPRLRRPGPSAPLRPQSPRVLAIRRPLRRSARPVRVAPALSNVARSLRLHTLLLLLLLLVVVVVPVPFSAGCRAGLPRALPASQPRALSSGAGPGARGPVRGARGTRAGGRGAGGAVMTR